ncbi:hypothetical protein [Natronomonas sp. LN261]|uniref:hypothetical protein n=1 Tax=Natronomonas sp. LN261 TaxID=2750669 RepID=UPI0015EF2575|nr:hypothetical protein [Natronomonas sp. LN261]
MNLREIPILGASAGILLDVLLYGGEFLAALLSVLATDVGSLLTTVSIMSTYVAPAVEWLPEGALNTLLVVLAAVLVGVNVARFLVSARENVS